jgi:hypothetical protein
MTHESHRDEARMLKRFAKFERWFLILVPTIIAINTVVFLVRDLLISK